MKILTLAMTTTAAALSMVPLSAHAAAPAAPSTVRVLATHTTRDSGLLDALVTAFQEQTGMTVAPTVAGTSEILARGARGEGDVLLTHWPSAEKAWMDAGHGTSRQLVMFDSFVIAGPAADPAGIRGLPVDEALQRIALTAVPFISRGDLSGTNARELQLWTLIGVDPRGQSWYSTSQQGQAETLRRASTQGAYVLTDSATFWATGTNLSILVDEDPRLVNAYHVITVSETEFPSANAEGGRAFASFLVSAQAQRLIQEFGVAQHQRSLWHPAASTDEFSLLASVDTLPVIENTPSSTPSSTP